MTPLSGGPTIKGRIRIRCPRGHDVVSHVLVMSLDQRPLLQEHEPVLVVLALEEFERFAALTSIDEQPRSTRIDGTYRSAVLASEHGTPGCGRLARYARNRRLADACEQWAFCSLTNSRGARAYYDQLRANDKTHHQALRQLANHRIGLADGFNLWRWGR
jgi:hypothetical protein